MSSTAARSSGRRFSRQAPGVAERLNAVGPRHFCRSNANRSTMAATLGWPERLPEPLEELAEVPLGFPEQLLVAQHVLWPAMLRKRGLDHLGPPEPLVRGVRHEVEPLRLGDAAHVSEQPLLPGADDERGELRVDDVAAVPKQEQESRLGLGAHDHVGRLGAVWLLDEQQGVVWRRTADFALEVREQAVVQQPAQAGQPDVGVLRGEEPLRVVLHDPAQGEGAEVQVRRVVAGFVREERAEVVADGGLVHGHDAGVRGRHVPQPRAAASRRPEQPDHPRLDAARVSFLSRLGHRRASQRRRRGPRLPGSNDGKLASSVDRPGPCRRRARSAIRCRQRIPRTRTSSTRSVSLRPKRARAGRTASHANASGERAARTSRRSARRLRDVSSLAQRARSSRAWRSRWRYMPKYAARQRAKNPRRRRSRARGPSGSRGSSVLLRDDAAENGAGVLHVVVERAVDIGDVAERHRDQREPVIVEVPAGPGRKRQCALDHATAEQAGRANDRVRDQERGEIGVVVPPALPQRLPADLAVGIDPSQVAVGELRRLDRIPQRRELVRIPAIVVVAERDELRLRRNHPQHPLEVPVEAETPLGARQHEPIVAGDGVGDRLVAIRRGAIVADQADPVRVGLPSNRLELGMEELEVRVVGGHADRDQWLPAGC